VRRSRVAALAGRLIDRPHTPRAVRRFPLERCPAVRARLRDEFVRRGVRTLVSSAACGADLLALSVAGELGMRRRVVLPRAVRSFKATSVAGRPGAWSDLYDRVIRAVRRANDLVVLPRTKSPYRAANERLLTEASRLAAGARPLAFLVWDRRRKRGDLTAHLHDEARRRRFAVVTIRTV
jgi:hypothetical protein